MKPNAVQRVTTDKNLAKLRIIERFDSKMIPSAKQLFVVGVPEREGKISPQTIDTRRAPGRVSLQNQIAVRCVRTQVPLGALQLINEFLAGVESRICDNPVAPLQARRLPLGLRFVRGSQQGMTHAYGPIQAHLTGIRSAKREKISKGLQQRRFDWRIVPVHDADETAQSTHPPTTDPAVLTFERGTLPSPLQLPGYPHSP